MPQGKDIRDGVFMAMKDFQDVEKELRSLAGDAQMQLLEGDERTSFFNEMTDEQADELFKLAQSLGMPGLSELELIMQEGEELSSG